MVVGSLQIVVSFPFDLAGSSRSLPFDTLLEDPSEHGERFDYRKEQEEANDREVQCEEWVHVNCKIAKRLRLAN